MPLKPNREVTIRPHISPLRAGHLWTLDLKQRGSITRETRLSPDEGRYRKCSESPGNSGDIRLHVTHRAVLTLRGWSSTKQPRRLLVTSLPSEWGKQPGWRQSFSPAEHMGSVLRFQTVGSCSRKSLEVWRVPQQTSRQWSRSQSH